MHAVNHHVNRNSDNADRIVITHRHICLIGTRATCKDELRAEHTRTALPGSCNHVMVQIHEHPIHRAHLVVSINFKNNENYYAAMRWLLARANSWIVACWVSFLYIHAPRTAAVYSDDNNIYLINKSDYHLPSLQTYASGPCAADLDFLHATFSKQSWPAVLKFYFWKQLIFHWCTLLNFLVRFLMSWIDNYCLNWPLPSSRHPQDEFHYHHGRKKWLSAVMPLSCNEHCASTWTARKVGILNKMDDAIGTSM